MDVSKNGGSLVHYSKMLPEPLLLALENHRIHPHPMKHLSMVLPICKFSVSVHVHAESVPFNI